MVNIIKGNLISMALNSDFDVIAHGCNCFCTMGAGIAPQMVEAFGVDKFVLEHINFKGDINKLGQIDWGGFYLKNGKARQNKSPQMGKQYDLFVINAYTQYRYGKNHTDGDEKPIDYEALTLCMRKINHMFKGKHIGLPWIGCGLAGGDKGIIKGIIKEELKDCKTTIVELI